MADKLVSGGFGATSIGVNGDVVSGSYNDRWPFTIMNILLFSANEVTIKPVKKKLTCVEGKKKCNPRCTVTKTAGVSYTK